VIAVDLRGYNDSEKPAGVQSYRMEHIVADIAEVCRQESTDSVTIVAHDIGGIAAWFFAMQHPTLLRKLIILNSPFPALYAKNFWRPAQLLKSWYAIFHQLPLIPEICWRAFHFAVARYMYHHHTVRKGAFSEHEIDHSIEALAKPGALTAAINYYRATRMPFGLKKWARDSHVVTVPTLLIWGEQDRYLSTFLLEGTEEWVPRLRIERLPNAGHWLQVEETEQVNRLIVEFLKQ
jgi:pimeloyl-ACP methyl ester carboxylesterase